jgi:hypothetical protein
VAAESVGCDRVIALLHVLGQVHRNRRRQMQLLAATFQRQAHGVRVRHTALERLLNGELHFGGPIAIQQTQQRLRDGSEIVATRGGAGEQ